MSFNIKIAAKSWRNKFVYKVLVKQMYGNSLLSPIFHCRWRKGQVKRISEIAIKHGGTLSKYPRSLPRARKGFYVFKTLKQAKKERQQCYRGLVVKLEVSPKDFLFTDRKNEIATYRQVKFIEVVK